MLAPCELLCVFIGLASFTGKVFFAVYISNLHQVINNLIFSNLFDKSETPLEFDALKKATTL